MQVCMYVHFNWPIITYLYVHTVSQSHLVYFSIHNYRYVLYVHVILWLITLWYIYLCRHAWIQIKYYVVTYVHTSIWVAEIVSFWLLQLLCMSINSLCSCFNVSSSACNIMISEWCSISLWSEELCISYVNRICTFMYTYTSKATYIHKYTF